VGVVVSTPSTVGVDVVSTPSTGGVIVVWQASDDVDVVMPTDGSEQLREGATKLSLICRGSVCKLILKNKEKKFYPRFLLSKEAWLQTAKKLCKCLKQRCRLSNTLKQFVGDVSV